MHVSHYFRESCEVEVFLSHFTDLETGAQCGELTSWIAQLQCHRTWTWTQKLLGGGTSGGSGGDSSSSGRDRKSVV